MRELTNKELKTIFPEFTRDEGRYLGDYAIRRIQDNPSLCTYSPPWKIVGGIGTLSCLEDGEFLFSKGDSIAGISLVSQFASSIKTWVDAGKPVTNKEDLDKRRSHCLSCPFFVRPTLSNAWIGKCGKCGCSMLKLYLETEHCPAGNW